MTRQRSTHVKITPTQLERRPALVRTRHTDRTQPRETDGDLGIFTAADGGAGHVDDDGPGTARQPVTEWVSRTLATEPAAA
jgi:hypothetical protein